MCINKVFFSVEFSLDCLCVKACVKTMKLDVVISQHRDIRVAGNTYVTADLWLGSPAG